MQQVLCCAGQRGWRQVCEQPVVLQSSGKLSVVRAGPCGRSDDKVSQPQFRIVGAGEPCVPDHRRPVSGQAHQGLPQDLRFGKKPDGFHGRNPGLLEPAARAHKKHKLAQGRCLFHAVPAAGEPSFQLSGPVRG